MSDRKESLFFFRPIRRPLDMQGVSVTVPIAISKTIGRFTSHYAGSLRAGKLMILGQDKLQIMTPNQLILPVAEKLYTGWTNLAESPATIE